MAEMILGKLYYYLRAFYWRYQYKLYRKRYNLSKAFRFNGYDILLYGDGNITIGSNTYIGRDSNLQCSRGTYIEIGDNCKIGPRFSVWTETSIVDADYNIESIPSKFGNIKIGNGVWIGVNVYISPGVAIGDNSIIGANSVVSKDIPASAVVGGIPAKIIRFKKYN